MTLNSLFTLIVYQSHSILNQHSHRDTFPSKPHTISTGIIDKI